MRCKAALLLAVCVVLAGCESGPPTTTPPGTAPTSTTAPRQTVSLAYSPSTGDTLDYRLELRRRVAVTTEQGPEAPFDGLPSSADVTITAEGGLSFDVADGVAAGTYRLTPGGELEVAGVEGTVDGEPVEDLSALDALGGLTTLPESVVIDGSGLIQSEGSGSTLPLVPGPVTGWPGFMGALLPLEPVTVGEEWSYTRSRARAGSVENETEVTGRVVEGGEPVDGGVAVVVEGEASTAPEDVDLSGFYADFLSSFGEGAEGVEPRLVLHLASREDRWQARFDPEEGRLRGSVASAATRTRVEGAAPDPAIGEETTFELVIEIEDELEAGVAPPPEA